MEIERLAKLIQCNPGCVVFVDNDNWQIYEKGSDKLIASSREFSNLGVQHGYGVLEALCYLCGLSLESV